MQRVSVIALKHSDEIVNLIVQHCVHSLDKEIKLYQVDVVA